MPIQHFLLALLVVATWGVNFVVIKVGLHGVPPFLLAALRFVLAAFPAVFFVKRPNVSFRYVFAFGFTLGVIHFGLLFLAIKLGISAGIASLVLQLQAFFTALFGVLVLHEKLELRQILGMVIAFSGIGLIATVNDSSVNVLGMAIMVVSAAFWGVANIVSKTASKENPSLNMLSFIVWASLVPPIPLALLSWLFEDHTLVAAVFTSPKLESFGALLYIAYLSTIFGFGVWTWLLGKYKTSQVAPLSLLVPVFGMLASGLLLHESFSALKLIGAGIVVLGLIVNVFGNQIFQVLKAQKASV
jgi:O-acetylserine/cysteine efflux transporter